MSKIRTYSELIKIPSFEERYKYLRLLGNVGDATFGYDRYLNQYFYRTPEWKQIRNQVIVRDNGCDLGMEGHDIFGKILVHHMNPLTAKDISLRNEDLFNPEFLICVSIDTHNAIHYSNESRILLANPIERKPNDTCPWRE